MGMITAAMSQPTQLRTGAPTPFRPSFPAAMLFAGLGMVFESLRADDAHYDLFHPKPANELRPLSTDRPDTTESAYTVDAGHFQVELEAFAWTHDREAPRTTDVWTGSANLKVGLLDFIDFQAVLTPYVSERVNDRAPAEEGTANGFGDTDLRMKFNLWGNDGGPTALALMPFVTLPTHDRDLGSGRRVEGGLIVPFYVEQSERWGFGFMLETDAVENEDEDGYTAEFVITGTIGGDIYGDLGGFLEFASITRAESGSEGQAYFNGGLTYALAEYVQLDAGWNLGLTTASDDTRLFVGLSFKI